MYSTHQIQDHVYAVDEGNTRMYLILGAVRALLLDTGNGTGDLRGLVRGLTDLPVTVALTHGHSDHTGAACQFGRVFAHKTEWEEIRGNPGGNAVVLQELNDGDSFDLGGRLIQVFLTAGHTPGSLSFLDAGNRILFAGDNVSDRTVYMCLPGADIARYRAALNWILGNASRFDTILGCHGTARQPLDQVRRLLACLDACEEGQTEDERVTIYSGDTVLRRTYRGASIYTPV